MDLAIAVGGRHDLVKGLAAAYETQVCTRTFLGSLKTVFEIDDLCVESRIAFDKLLVQQPLLGDCGPQAGSLAITAIGKPQLGLQRNHSYAEYQEHPAHLFKTYPNFNANNYSGRLY